MSIIGDSYTSGSNEGGKGKRGWPALVTEQLANAGINVVADIGAEGGSGYVQQGNSGGGVFGDKVPSTVKPYDGLVLFFGSRNDSKAPVKQLAAAVCDALGRAEIAAPAAALLVIGPAWTGPNPPPGVLRARDILRQQTNALGGHFADPLADKWFVDEPNLIGTDGIHPTDAGHEYLAEKIRPLIEEQLKSNPRTRPH